MAQETHTSPTSERDLILERVFDAAPERVYRAWTEPELLRQWFAPLPYTTPLAELDVRPGGSNLIVMRDPDGNDSPMKGVYLEVKKNAKLVFTDAYVNAWEPSAKPFMTVIISLTDLGGKTQAVYTVRHWTNEDYESHVKMGFHEGWGICADQLAELLDKG